MRDALDLVVCGDLVLPDRILEGGWVGVRDGRIMALGEGAELQAARIYRAGDALVFPGFIDGQTHACSYGGLPGLESTTRSAVAGGIATIVDMPYDQNGLVNSSAALRRKVETIEQLAHADVSLYGTVAPDQGTGDLAGLIEDGACALKISSFESHPKRFPRISNDEVLNLLEYAADTSLPVGLHNEESDIVRARVRELASRGCTSPQYQFAQPAAGGGTGGHCDVSRARSGDGRPCVHRPFLRPSRLRPDFPVQIRRCACHGRALCPLSPFRRRRGYRPARREDEGQPSDPRGVRKDLWNGLRDGKVELLSSDHSSWPIGNKLTPSIFDAGAGMTGLESMVPSLFTDLFRNGFDPVPSMRRYLAERPAKFFGRWPRKGAIAIGADADFAILKREAVQFRESETHDGLNWSAYDGERFEVRVAATFVRGRQMWDGSEILGVAGHGRFIPRTGSSIFSLKEGTGQEQSAGPPS